MPVVTMKKIKTITEEILYNYFADLSVKFRFQISLKKLLNGVVIIIEVIDANSWRKW